MLPGGTDLLYRSILAGPHEVISRIEVWATIGGVDIRLDTYGDEGIPYSSGSVSATLASRVARVLSLSVPRGLFPDDATGLLAPFGNYLKAYSGVSNSNGQYLWPVFVGRINDITLTSDGTVSLTAIDRAGDIQDSYFSSPAQSVPNRLITTEFKQLIRDALPNATFGVFDSQSYDTCPALTWNADRAAACDDLANASNLIWYPLANGDFVMRQAAWTNDLPVEWTYTTTASGSVLAWSAGFSRTNVSNQIIVVGELTDGTAPVFALAQDNDPTSATYVNGKFGLKGQYFSIQTVRTQGQGRHLAYAQLLQSRSITQVWGAQMVPDAALELGDVVALRVASGMDERMSGPQVVTAFTLSLDSRDTMNLTLQAQVPGDLLANGQ